MVRRRSNFLSEPPMRRDNPRTLLTKAALNDIKTRSRLQSEHRPREGRLTTLSGFRRKPQVLLTDEPQRLSSVIKRSKCTLLIPFMSKVMRDRHLKEFYKDIMMKSKIVCIFRKSLDNKEFIQFVADLMKLQQEEFGRGNEVARKILRMRALLFDGVKSLPGELKGLFPIITTDDLLPENVVQFIEGNLEATLERVKAFLAEADLGPRLMIWLKIRLPGVDDADYMRSCWKALIDAFEDAGSPQRQYLLQLLHIPNVETVRLESDVEKHEVCIEVQPNSAEDYLRFLEACHDGQFQSVVRDNLRVYSETFAGVIDPRVDVKGATRVLKYFHRDVVTRQAHVVRKLLEDGRVEELRRIIKTSPTCNARKEDRVHKLAAACATKIYEAFLTRSDLSPFQYLKYLEKAGLPDFLTEIRTADGYNALHLAIRGESDDFMKMLFYANKWGVLRKDVVKPVNVRADSRHVGYVPRRLAEALSFTDSGFHILEKFDAYDENLRSMPPLHKVCLLGCIPFASSMIEIHPYLMEEKDANYANCLFYACASGNDQLVQYLLLRGVPRNVPNVHGETPLHAAAMFGHLNVLRVLSDDFFDIRGRPNKDGYDALYYAARFGDLAALRLYKEKRFKIDATALTIAAKHEQYEVFDFVLEDIADVNEGKDCEGRVTLHYAVISGNEAAVKKLIKKKADITLLDKYDQNVLHLAAEHGKKEAMESIINEAKRAGCLEQMISTKNVFTDKSLLVVIRGKDRGRKAWHYVELRRLYVGAFKKAMKTGQVDVARYGDILKSEFGAYPDDECQRMMEKRAADILSERRKDMTALLVAALKDNAGLVEMLLNNGASANDQDYEGATALHYAAMNNSIAVLHLLSKAGASFDIKTVGGKTALDIAEDVGSSEALHFLQAPVGIAENLYAILSKFEEAFSEEKLNEMRSHGINLQRYLVDHLRALLIEINSKLIELDSGPVHQISEL